MTLKDLNLKGNYNSITDDLYNDFFNPVLSNSKYCTRIGGIFTTRNFAACAEGMQDFIKNDGFMKLILIPTFSNEDIDAINQGLSTEENKIVDDWITKLDDIKDKFEENHTRALAWLLKNELLEIRVVIIKDTNGKILNDKQISNMSIFKRKIGIFHGDQTDEIISFQGNIDFNEELLGDYYNIDVYRNWDDSESKWVNQHHKEFQQYWRGKSSNDPNLYTITTIPLPEAIKKNIIKIAPKSKYEINLKSIPKLRSYQKEAINNWIKNKGRGVFEMATGTGKTITSINAILALEKESLLVIIVCPYTTLIDQWKKELQKINIFCTITPENKYWQTEMQDIVHLLNAGKLKNIRAVITTYVTYSNPNFTSIIKKTKIPTLLLADEVHHAGSTEYQKGLIDDYSYRIGLTATLERYFDSDGTAKLTNYFGGTIFEYDLKKAIDAKILVGYYYKPIYVDLTDEEYEKYQKESRTIGMYANSKNYGDQEKLEQALRRRSYIIRDAINKIDAFSKLIEENQDLKHTLIYCSEKQIDKVQKILTDSRPHAITNRRITAENPKKIEDRVKVINSLAQEYYMALVAIGVLDEGVDIPQAKICILMASTGNPKQFIQRRGRVLRQYFGKYKDGSKKEYATIYDLLILPRLNDNMSDKEKKIETSIIRSQLRRHYDMATIAINSKECLEEIKLMESKLNLQT